MTVVVNHVILSLTDVVTDNVKEEHDLLSKFMNLEDEKRERIINAALGEFAQKGYKNASTNEIVNKANISKGLLFHYFNNKKGLFLFLLDYSKDIFVNEFYEKFNMDETDIIKRFRQISILKIKLIRKYPDMYDFLLSSMTDDSAEIKYELDNVYKNIIDDFYQKLTTNLDTSVIKNGLDIKRVSEIIIWVMQGFANRELEKLKHNSDKKPEYDIDAAMVDFDEYIELLKNAFYK